VRVRGGLGWVTTQGYPAKLSRGYATESALHSAIDCSFCWRTARSLALCYALLWFDQTVLSLLLGLPCGWHFEKKRGTA